MQFLKQCTHVRKGGGIGTRIGGKEERGVSINNVNSTRAFKAKILGCGYYPMYMPTSLLEVELKQKKKKFLYL